MPWGVTVVDLVLSRTVEHMFDERPERQPDMTVPQIGSQAIEDQHDIRHAKQGVATHFAATGVPEDTGKGAEADDLVSRFAWYMVSNERIHAAGFNPQSDKLMRESLVSIERMLLFLSANTAGATLPDDLRAEVRTTLRDLQSLEDHATFLSNKIQFLLDAVLGLVHERSVGAGVKPVW